MDNLFLKSLKGKGKFNPKFLPNRKFSQSNDDRFKPTQPKEVRFFNREVTKSKRCEKLKFTNFLSNSPGTEVYRLESLVYDVSVLNNMRTSSVRFNNKRITDILNLNLIDFNPRALNDDSIVKVDLRNEFNQQDGVRIYVYMDTKNGAYDIIMIDLFHLVIPSKHKKKNKHTVLNETYKINQHNKQCISSFIDV